MRTEEHKCDVLIITTIRTGKLGLAVYRLGGFQKNKTNKKKEKKKTPKGRGNNNRVTAHSPAHVDQDLTAWPHNTVGAFVTVNAQTREKPNFTPNPYENTGSPIALHSRPLTFTPHRSHHLSLASSSAVCDSSETSMPSKWKQLGRATWPLVFFYKSSSSPASPREAIFLSQFPSFMLIWGLMIWNNPTWSLLLCIFLEASGHLHGFF